VLFHYYILLLTVKWNALAAQTLLEVFAAYLPVSKISAGPLP
jgi:hypothetical protein